MIATRVWPRSLLGGACLVGGLLGACGVPEEGPEAVVHPPVAVTEPGGDEPRSLPPISAEDVGELVLASGIVVGNPGPEGFFLRTERGQVVLVRSPQPARVGQAVRATGVVHEALGAGKEEILGTRDSLGWNVAPYYIDATRVVSTVTPSL